jgi:hypothetical protein
MPGIVLGGIEHSFLSGAVPAVCASAGVAGFPFECLTAAKLAPIRMTTNAARLITLLFMTNFLLLTFWKLKVEFTRSIASAFFKRLSALIL